MDFRKQGTALVCEDEHLHNKYEIQESKNGKFALQVNGEVVHCFDNQEHAVKVAELIEEDAWN